MLVVVAPASADLLAKMATGWRTIWPATILLATRAPVLVAPAMNPAMWEHPATRAQSGGPARPRRARWSAPAWAPWPSRECGPGRLAEPEEIFAAIAALLAPADGRWRAARAGHLRPDA